MLSIKAKRHLFASGEAPPLRGWVYSALPLLEVSYAAGQSTPEVTGRASECAAAFPIF